ncbi:hypothetical protein [Fodinibius salsisoli]|uniref:Matrixin n=1 Tax=Fodinibius salsisoli TaxID=2820877 RepID=A0ABT3PKB4_9BACT|nr:hypothetical protein [Fodinibius salsisoli]MCW9706381.1 hypothetical protein [Fodinibius salsisoli]
MIKVREVAIGVLTLAAFIISSCSESYVNSSTPEENSPSTVTAQTQGLSSIQSLQGERNINLDGMDSMEDINQKLAERGLNVRLAYAETVTQKQGAETAAGQTIYANDRQKRLTAQWVPDDDRRNADGNNLTYLTYGPFAPANFGTADQLDGEPAIDASMDTWNNVKKNAKLNILRREDTGVNPSAILGGDPFLADITEFGFVPGLFFELFVGPGSSSNVLGVTFTFVFIDDAGNPTDINNDGYEDTALKEVWYNDDFLWTDTGNTADAIDIETVALHENGHALGFGHFGKISVTDSNNKLHVSPRAVMNAIILGTQHDLLGTDKASYNSVYGNWPKN